MKPITSWTMSEEISLSSTSSFPDSIILAENKENQLSFISNQITWLCFLLTAKQKTEELAGCCQNHFMNQEPFPLNNQGHVAERTLEDGTGITWQNKPITVQKHLCPSWSSYLFSQAVHAFHDSGQFIWSCVRHSSAFIFRVARNFPLRGHVCFRKVFCCKNASWMLQRHKNKLVTQKRCSMGKTKQENRNLNSKIDVNKPVTFNLNFTKNKEHLVCLLSN